VNAGGVSDKEEWNGNINMPKYFNLSGL
jgi:hypothetical protein